MEINHIADAILNGYGKNVDTITPYSFQKDFFPGQIFLESERNLYFGTLTYFCNRKAVESRLEIFGPNKEQLYLYSDSPNPYLQEILFSGLKYQYFGDESIPEGNNFAVFNFPKLGFSGTLNLNTLPSLPVDFYRKKEYLTLNTSSSIHMIDNQSGGITGRDMSIGIQFHNGSQWVKLGLKPENWNTGGSVADHQARVNSAYEVYYNPPFLQIRNTDGNIYNFNTTGKGFGTHINSQETPTIKAYLDGQSYNYSQYVNVRIRTSYESGQWYLNTWMQYGSDWIQQDKVPFDFANQTVNAYLHPKHKHSFTIQDVYLEHQRVASIWGAADGIHFDQLIGAEYTDFVSSLTGDYYENNVRLIQSAYGTTGQRALLSNYLDYRFQVQFTGYKITLK